MFLAGVREVPRGNRSLKTSLKLNMPLQACMYYYLQVWSWAIQIFFKEGPHIVFYLMFDDYLHFCPQGMVRKLGYGR